MNNDKLLEKFKMNAAISNLKKEYSAEENKKVDNLSIIENIRKWSKYAMKKRIVAGICMVIILLTGVVLGAGYIVERIFNTKRNEHLNEVAENGYIQNIDMEYIEKDGIKFKVDYLLMDDLNLDLVFNFRIEDDISNYEGISIPGILITDENNNQIFCDSEDYKIHSKSSAKIMGWDTIEKSNNIMRQLLFLESKNFPKSKKIYVSFDRIVLYNVNNGNPFTKEINGDWKIELDVDEQFTNRTNIEYEVSKNDYTDKVQIREAKLTNTGFVVYVKASIFKEVKEIALKGENQNLYQVTYTDMIEDQKAYMEAYEEVIKTIPQKTSSPEDYVNGIAVLTNDNYEEIDSAIKKILYPDEIREAIITFNMTKYNKQDEVQIVFNMEDGENIVIDLIKK